MRKPQTTLYDSASTIEVILQQRKQMLGWLRVNVRNVKDVMTYFKKPFWHFPGGAKENFENVIG